MVGPSKTDSLHSKVRVKATYKLLLANLACTRVEEALASVCFQECGLKV